MKFSLIFKQAVKDFKNKVQLYLSFIAFILISVALVLGLFSFNFTAQKNYRDTVNSTLPINEKIRTFHFVSVNGDQQESLKKRWLANTYQVENGELSKYVYDQVFQQEFQINENGSVYRRFNDDEMKLLWNDIGFDWNPNTKALTVNMEKYFDNNVINFIGQNAGDLYYSFLEEYQNLLGLNREDLSKIFDGETGQINPGLESNINYLRYAAYAKVNFFTRSNNRWFSNDKNDQFYDHNLTFNSNLVTKFTLETKIIHRDNKKILRNTDYEIEYGMVPWRLEPWIQVDGLPGAKSTEALLPGEKWMADFFAWDKWNKSDLVEKEGKPPGLLDWDHIPDIAMKNRVTNLKIYDRLPLDQVDKEVLANGTYVFVSPIFLQVQDLKLGDKISRYTTAYDEGYETLTIIGTAVDKPNIFETGERSTFYVPFQQLMKRNGSGIGALDISIPKLKKNFYKANQIIKQNLYGDFQQLLIPEGKIDNFLPKLNEFEDLEVAKTTMLFFNLITYLVGLLTLILLFVVFYFITDQSIKLQKNTLKFLKSMGGTNFELSLVTTLSSLVPIIVGAGLGIVASFGVSQIMISVSNTVFPYYIPWFSINKWAWFILLGLMLIIFSMFLLMNTIIMRGPILRLGQNSYIGWVTKGFIRIKPMFKYFKPSTRIGISFIAKNLFKNLLTFILLTLSFGIVLFSSQFKYSSDSSARAFERRYSPYSSVFFDQQNTADSIGWNISYLENLFPNVDEILKNPIINTITQKLWKDSYYQGAIGTYRNPQGKFTSVETGQEVQLTGIETKDGKGGDEYFNELIKNQIGEIFTAIDKTVDNPATDLELNPEYDLKNYFLTKNYTKELMLEGTSASHAEKIFSFSDDEVNTYAKNVKDLIRKLEKNYGDGKSELFPGKTDDEIVVEMAFLIKQLQQSAIENFTEQLDELKTSSIDVKNSFSDFDFGINLYFNRSILPVEGDQKSVLSTAITLKGQTISGIGIDERNQKTASMVSHPLGILKPNKTNFSEKYIYHDTNEDIAVRAMDVYVSGNLADSFRITNNEILAVYANGFAFENHETPLIYLRVVGIVREASFLQEIYFNKTDLFNYLKVMLEDRYSLADLFNRSDYLFYTTSLEKIRLNPNGQDLFNNSVFSLNQLPYGISHFSMDAKLAAGYSILSYTYLPIFEYASQNFPVSLGRGVYVFSAVTQMLLKTINPIIKALDRFIILLILITLAIALILITLILLENKNIILLFKSLGYRKMEVNMYITMGYIIATILALVLGAAISYFVLRLASTVLINNLGISLFFVWSVPYLLLGIGMALAFIATTLVAVTIYTNRLDPKTAFSDL